MPGVDPDLPELEHPEKAALFLAYAYRFPKRGGPDADASFDLAKLHAAVSARTTKATPSREVRIWAPPPPEGTKYRAGSLADDLLPHIQQHIEDGETIRVIRHGDVLGTWFGELRAPIVFEDRKGMETVSVVIDGPPTLYLLESGIVFVVIGVRPAEPSWPAFLEMQWRIVRRGMHYLPGDTIPRKLREGLESLLGSPPTERTSLRVWLAALVAGIEPEPPPGAREAPLSFGLIATRSLPDETQLHRLRLAQRANQELAPSNDGSAASSLSYRPSANEVCLFSPLATNWVVANADAKTIALRREHLARHYALEWVLVQHQRLFLLELSTRCASLAKTLLKRIRPEDLYGEFEALELERLWYFGLFDFSQLSHEERREQFYRAQRAAIDVTGLFEEVRQEITELLSILAERRARDAAFRADALNEAVAVLAFVFTPLGILVGVFQRETLPENLRSPHAWLTHGPFWAAVLLTCVCVALLVRFRRGSAPAGPKSRAYAHLDGEGTKGS